MENCGHSTHEGRAPFVAVDATEFHVALAVGHIAGLLESRGVESDID